MYSGDSGSEPFGALLRFFRERAGMTQEALGKHVGYSKSQVAMVERGERSPRGDFAQIADQVLGAQGALLVLAKKEFVDGHRWQRTEDYIAEEKTAAALYIYQSMLIPGLLQTEAYARAVFTTSCYPTYEDEEIERLTASRVQRQQLFDRKPAPSINYVLEENTLTRPLGGRDVLKAQLQHVLAIASLRHVEIQVMPHDRTDRPWPHCNVILLETAERCQLAYVEGHRAIGYFVSEQPDLANLYGKYGILRAKALNPDESATLIEKVARDL